MESKLKNINYIRYINIIFLTLIIFSIYNYADTKMTTCCCGSCREGGNQENNSISSNNPDLLQKSNFNLLNKKKDNKNPLENINKNEDQNFLSNNDTAYMDTEENNNNRSELNASSGINNISKISNPNKNNENSLKDIDSSIEKNFNETNNTSKNKITIETTENYNTNSLNKILNSSENNNNINNTENDQIKIDNNPINTENNNKSLNNSKENSSIQASSFMKLEDISNLIKDNIDTQKKIFEESKDIMKIKKQLYDIKLSREEKLRNEQNLINDLNTYIQNGYGLGKDHRDLTSIYNDYVKEYGNKYINTQKKEDIIELIKNLIKFFNKKKEKVENLMNTLNSNNRFNNEFNNLNKNINDALKNDYVNNYDEIFKADRETYNDYLSLIEELGKINVINTEDKNKIYNYFSKLEICYQAVKKELENINQEIIEINYEKNKKCNNFENFLIKEGINIKDDVFMLFEVLKNSEICLEINNITKNVNNPNIKVEGNKPYFLVLKKIKNYIKFNIVKCGRGNKYSEVTNLKQQVMNYDKDLKDINLRPQSDIIKLKCIIKKNPTEPKKKEENKKKNTTHTKYKSTLTNDTFRKTLIVNKYSSPSISKKTNKIYLTNKKNNKPNAEIEKIIRTEHSKKNLSKIDNTKKKTNKIIEKIIGNKNTSKINNKIYNTKK